MFTKTLSIFSLLLAVGVLNTIDAQLVTEDKSGVIVSDDSSGNFTIGPVFVSSEKTMEKASETNLEPKVQTSVKNQIIEVTVKKGKKGKSGKAGKVHKLFPLEQATPQQQTKNSESNKTNKKEVRKAKQLIRRKLRTPCSSSKLAQSKWARKVPHRRRLFR